METAATADAQQLHLARVSARIGTAIIWFCRGIMATQDRTFRMQDMLSAVTAICGVVAPDSPSRVLRDLKAKGAITYRVLNRAQSLYQIEGVK